MNEYDTIYGKENGEEIVDLRLRVHKSTRDNVHRRVRLGIMRGLEPETMSQWTERIINDALRREGWLK